MTDREIMQQALDSLITCEVQIESEWGVARSMEQIEADGDTSPVILALRERLAQPEQEPVAHYVIAGVLFDFMGWLTSRKERLVLSSADEASPAVDAIRDFAKMRGLSLEDAKVQEWTDKIRART